MGEYKINKFAQDITFKIILITLILKIQKKSNNLINK